MLAMLVAAAACDSGQRGSRRIDSSPILARVGDETFTVADLEAIIRRQSGAAQIFASAERKRALLDAEVRLMVMADRAARLGLDRDPEVIRARRQQAAALLVRREIDEKADPSAISEAEVQDYFASHSPEFNRPEEAHVVEVVVKDRARAEAVAKEARQARHPETAADQAAFRDIVVKQSEDPQAKVNGGDLGYLRRGHPTHDPELVGAALALSAQGEVSAPVKAGGNYHVLKLVARRAAITRSVNDVSSQIRQRLAAEKRQTRLQGLVDEATKGAKVEVFADRLDDVKAER
jgi:parvulin-like peptidyl-prolyl isomerase